MRDTRVADLNLRLALFDVPCYYLPHRPAPGTSGITPQIGSSIVRVGSRGKCWFEGKWPSLFSETPMEQHRKSLDVSPGHLSTE